MEDKYITVQEIKSRLLQERTFYFYQYKFVSLERKRNAGCHPTAILKRAHHLCASSLTFQFTMFIKNQHKFDPANFHTIIYIILIAHIYIIILIYMCN